MKDDKTTSAELGPKAQRMKEIRQNRRAAGFAEVTVWMPVELIQWLRDLAWVKVDESGRTFPNRTQGPQARRRRRQ